MASARELGLGEGMRIQRTIAEPADWKPALEAIEDPDVRQAAREYLLGIWQRSEAIKAHKAAAPTGTRTAIIPPQWPREADPEPDHATSRRRNSAP